MPVVIQPAGRFEWEPKRLLLVLPSWVGDLVMATPLLRAMRQRFPRAHIAALVRQNLMDLLSGGDWIDEIVPWSTVFQTACALRTAKYDTAMLLPNSFRTALTVCLARIPRRIGYDRDGRWWLLTDRLRAPDSDRPVRMVEYYGAIAEFVGSAPPGDRLELFTDSGSEAAIEQRLGRVGFNDSQPLVVISPGASFGSSKLWLPERFAEVGDRLAEEFGAAVAVTCAAGEEPIARRVADQMRRCAWVFDEPVCSLGEFKALVRRCDLLINNDTGPRHIAKAFNAPVVTVFGSTDPRWTDTSYRWERQVRIDVDCGPCQQKTCPLGHHKCMTGVTVEMVVDACRALLRQRVTGGHVYQ
ncbi:MAG TPA: lipopolysaccharide heptosyltransferase II [Phycisphaerae bacterium]|jgi:heptosyltransferase-2